ncbi:MAG: ChaN family lipoprotein [Planctomycetes bacterium]|nr:ChaN family lipoprotein [Planctomycetota bacterium]
MKKKMWLFGLAAVSALVIQNIWAAPPVIPPPPSSPIELRDLKEMPTEKLIGNIYSVAKKKFVSFDEMIAEAIKSNIIYVGETHDNVLHHQMQEKVLRAVVDKNGQTRKIALAMEMFQRPYQSFLDDYTAGKISEPELLRKTEYYTRWSFDWSMYQPMVNLARTNGFKVVAMNAPAEISRKVARNGLKSLTAEERKLLPEKIDTADKNHRDYITERFKAHSGMGMNFENFYESQCIWEDTMADSVAGFFRALGPDAANGHEVVVVGGGHIIYRFGIPARAKWRTGLNYSSILCVETSPGGVMDVLEGYGNNPADYLCFTKILKIDEVRPLMGVQLAEPKADTKGLTVVEAVAGGPAAKAGLQKDDVIIMVDNQLIADMVDLKCALGNKKAGDKVEITVQRGKDTKKLTLVLELRRETEHR